MRRVALLLIGLGLLAASACATTTVVDAECISNGGLCFATNDPDGCGGGPLPYGCESNFQCCATVYAANYANGAVIDGSSGAPVDGATDGDAVGPVDAAKDSGRADVVTVMESGTDAARDVTAHD